MTTKCVTSPDSENVAGRPEDPELTTVAAEGESEAVTTVRAPLLSYVPS
jgi:hypothetical protein